MTVRLIKGEKPYTAGDGIDISTDKVISVLLRKENNLIHLNSNNELYTDLQIVAGAKPTDDFEVGVTTGRVLESDGRPKTGTLLHYETTSGDYCQWLYSTDTNLYFDGGDGNRRQVYYADQVNEMFIRWMDFYFNTPTGNNITVGLSTDYTPTGDFTINAPEEIKDGQTYILRVNNEDTAYTMTLGTNIDNMQGTDISLTPNATDMFVFLAVGGKLELQKEMPDGSGESNTKTFYLSSTSDLITAQAAYDWYLAGKNPIIRIPGWDYSFILEGDNSEPFHHLGFYGVNGGVEEGMSNSSIGINPRLVLLYSSNTVTSVGVSRDNANVLFTDVNYSTPYTPQYDGSPATKKYVDDSVSVVSGDTGTKYTIKVSHSDPSGVANNVITFVTPLLEYSELIALNNATAIVNELNSDASGYFNKYLDEGHIGEDFDPELVRPNYYYLEDNGTAFTIDGRRFLMEDGTTEWFYEG